MKFDANLSIKAGILAFMFWPTEKWTIPKFRPCMWEGRILCIGPFHLEWFSNKE